MINHEETIKPSQVLVLEQPHLDKWRQMGTTRDKNLIFSALTRQSKLGKLLVISAASLFLVAGWTYTIARQSQNQQNSTVIEFEILNTFACVQSKLRIFSKLYCETEKSSFSG
jgi:hypothetical protein